MNTWARWAEHRQNCEKCYLAPTLSQARFDRLCYVGARLRDELTIEQRYKQATDWRRALEAECGWEVTLEMVLENGAKFSTDEDLLVYIIGRRLAGLPPGGAPLYPYWQQDRDREVVLR